MNMEKKYFVTFGIDHEDRNGNNLCRKYMIVSGETYGEAREKAFAARGPDFAFMYEVNELHMQKKQYRLEEVSIEDATITDVGK